MWKALLAGATALTIGGASLVYAQQGAGAAAGAPRARVTAEDAQAFTDAHIAALKAGLKLTPDQDKNWPPVEAAIRDLAKPRVARLQEQRAHSGERRGGAAPRDAIALLRARADAMSERAAGLKRLADAAEPLYKSLDDSQKRRLPILSRSMRVRAEWRGGQGSRQEQRL